ncbi:MAG: cyclic nucleotide-binding domain-containing protein [Alphaproteobacteria bacterium]|nr:cyclic nucleotide-binding domain-containing protein [Alphaproteobacteria bacterium]
MPDILDILPFRYLGREARERVASKLVWTDWPEGRALVKQGDLTDDRVFLLESGTVDIIDHRLGPDTKVGQIEAGHYFGERPALFGEPRAVEVRAQTDCRTATLSGDDFVALVRSERSLAHALTFVLRDKQGMFTDFTSFLAEVKLGTSRGHIVIGRLIPAYKRLHPALHRHCNRPDIDFGALQYATRRLPDNVSRTFVWFVTDDCPPHYAEAAARMFTDVTAKARRRVSWEMIPGKSLVLLRDGLSDLLDLVTCLCTYAIEARKLRRRLRNANVLVALSTDAAEATLAAVFTPREREELERLWPGEVAQRLTEISMHHEDITVHSYKRTNNYNSAHAETWTHQIAAATSRLLGTAPWELPEDYEVHVISSNTHSVTNCLSPWLAENADRLLAWGRAHRPELVDAPWTTPADCLIALLRPYLESHPEAALERAQRDRDVCISLGETAFTGIAVELIDLAKLGRVSLDAELPHCGRSGLVVNIDYAFGQQAEPIIANLVNLFGRRIRSVNILGKAGGLRGERGDLLVATAFVTQLDDALLCPPVHLDIERLKARIPERQVFVGRVLTVLGTILQNDKLLHTYDKLWDCIGLEMEGSFYARQLVESRELGILRDDVELRFLYYVSDLPLRHDASLSSSMSAIEGIPPLYAITREVLTAILEPRGA